MEQEIDAERGSLESRPGIFLIGSPNVGKRTLLSRLLSIDIPDTSDLSGGVLCQGWKLDTKYYSADISIWTAHLTKDFSFGTLPITKQLAGLVMVFDMSDESSFLSLKEWVANVDLDNFEILLCIGNKADLIPGHSAHAEYRRYLQKRGESTSDPHPEFVDYGIDEAEGCSLLGEEEPFVEIRRSFHEWCVQHNIEYIEACASNTDFDKCLSVDGDIQGVQRLYGALAAHMWPGMAMKSGESITAPSFVHKKEEMTDDDESDYEIEYEILSRGSDEPWEYVGVSCNDIPSTSGTAEDQTPAGSNQDLKHEMVGDNRLRVDISASQHVTASGLPLKDVTPETGTSESSRACIGIENEEQEHQEVMLTSEVEAQENVGVDAAGNVESDDDLYYGHEDMERLMCEIGSMRDNLRLMPDFQRREMAAKLALKMATMFGGSGDEDEKPDCT